MKRMAVMFTTLLLSPNLLAQDKFLRETNEYYQKPLDELLHIETSPKAEVGSRSGARDAIEAEVPVDVITSAQLESSGYTQLNNVLTKLVPGFSSPRPSITDGTDHAPPFTLRGLNPDQVLVLINGKRLHQSSLLNVNGTVGRGTSGVDLNTIPLRAIDRVEVLRDGAAAQYGSDAIAGIINIILKGYGYARDSRVTTTYGSTTQGDGITRQADLFKSWTLKNDGFVNITAEARDRGPSNRAGGDSRDHYRINHLLGDANTQDGLLAFNAELPGDDLTFYGQGMFDRRLSSAGALYRLAKDTRNNPAIYPNGFLPMIEPKITDYSASIGVKGVSSANVRWDLNYTHGYNDFHFYVANSLNTSLGNNSPTSFDSGATSYSQDQLNLDVQKKIGDLQLAGGAEYRREGYRIRSGEQSSYVLGSAGGSAGAQGFPGFQPQNVVNASRKNSAIYTDAKYLFSRALTVEGAARYEHYSDFGSNLDEKLALAYHPNDDFLVRASSSTGFRAPSLSQSYYTATVSAQYRDDNIIQTGTFNVYDPVAIALGAKPLRPEKSTHHTLGVVYQPTSNFSLSADYFNTIIDDRIMITGNISQAASAQVMAILQQYGVQYARYFTNAIATRTQGLDMRLDFKHGFKDGSKFKTAASYHLDRTKITDIYPLASILGNQAQASVINSTTRSFIESIQPRDFFKLWSQYETEKYRTTVNLNRFGSITYVNDHFGAKWTVDVDLAFQPSKNIQLAVGGENVLGTMPDKTAITGNAVTSGNGVIPYGQFFPYGYNGAFYYIRLNIGI